MSELGPFYPTPGGRLQKNQHAWNQIANIIFLESPAFVGWSYSNTSTDIVVGKHSRPKFMRHVLHLFTHHSPLRLCVLTLQQYAVLILCLCICTWEAHMLT